LTSEWVELIALVDALKPHTTGSAISTIVDGIVTFEGTGMVTWNLAVMLSSEYLSRLWRTEIELLG
jgi:hypothetical protein